MALLCQETIAQSFGNYEMSSQVKLSPAARKLFDAEKRGPFLVLLKRAGRVATALAIYSERQMPPGVQHYTHAAPQALL